MCTNEGIGERSTRLLQCEFNLDVHLLLVLTSPEALHQNQKPKLRFSMPFKRSWQIPTTRAFEQKIAEKCDKYIRNNVHECYYRRSTIESLPVDDSKTVPKFCSHHNLYCVHTEHPLLKRSCLFECGGKFNPLSLSQNSKSLLEQEGPSGVGDACNYDHNNSPSNPMVNRLTLIE